MPSTRVASGVWRHLTQRILEIKLPSLYEIEFEASVDPTNKTEYRMKLKPIFFGLALSTAVMGNAIAAPAPDTAVDPANPALLPLPQSVEWGNAAIPLGKIRTIYALESSDPLRVAQLKKELGQLLERNQVSISDKAEQTITFQIGSVIVPGQWMGQANEAYELSSDEHGVVVSANDIAGLYYGLQTLRQLMVHKQGQTTVAACKIHDYPAFKIRGFMHDVGRNFQSLDQLRMQIDTVAAYKINTFHFHLTEYHGWRLESKIYPDLQADSSFTRKPGKFYTQEEFVEFVDYCHARGITVIPEFDSPGHSDAFRKGVGVERMSDPRALEAMTRLLDELCALVPKEKMPYIHVGTDEVHGQAERVGDDYLATLHQTVHRNGREVIGWMQGMHLPGDTRQIQQTWASSKPMPGMRHIDSRSNYLNYLQALDFATRVHFQQPCRVPHGDEINLGGIICYWPDTKVEYEKQALLNSPVLSAVVGYSEAVWKGVERDHYEYWCKIPPRGTAEHASYADFEERLIEQRDRFMAGKPFLALRTHNLDWRYLGPGTEGQFPELEKGIIKDFYNSGGKRYRWSDPIQGGTIHIRHFFGFPSHIKAHPKGKDIVWANTFIHSDKDQTIDAWIDFNTIAASGYKSGEQLRPQGQWDMNRLCDIWINGERIAPPDWTSTQTGYEYALQNEIYSARPPSKITLKKGWNSVLVRTGRSYKWVFSFCPIRVDEYGTIREVEGLVFSPYKSLEPVVVTPLHTATIPADRFGVNWWKPRHDEKMEAARKAKCDILFIGDSITHMWETRSGDLWEKEYLTRNAFNIGYSGDQTQHVLWRLDNGEMNHFKPKVAVVMIGTNNSGHQPNWSAQKVAEGVRAIIDRVHKHSPETQVLLLGIFPRGAGPTDPIRMRNDEVNALIGKFDDGDKVHYLDLAPTFLDGRGNLSREIMPDLLHPNEKGYMLWAEAMEPKLKELLRNSKAPGAAYNTALIPVPKLENDFYDWHQRHEQVKKRIAQKKPVDLIFVGDSITHMFGGEPVSRIARGVQTWNQYYEPRNAVNMGFGWDRTQNMLWRLLNGELEGISPKVAVVLAGTNNLTGTDNAPTNTPEEIAAGIKAVCETIHAKTPKTQIILLGILPRGQLDLNPKIKEINRLIQQFDKEKYITVVDMWDKFANADDTPNRGLFQDTAHPNAKGYAVWADTLEPTLKKLF